MGLVITSIDRLSPQWRGEAELAIASHLGQVRARAIARAQVAAATRRPEAARSEPTRRSVHRRPPAARPDASWYLDAPRATARPAWRL